MLVDIGLIVKSSSKPELFGASFSIDDQFKLCLNYSLLITNFAEKSVLNICVYYLRIITFKVNNVFSHLKPINSAS